jgi:hypothetical protein
LVEELYMKLILGKCIAATLALAICPASFANLLTNGSFESGTFTWDGNNADSLGVGSSVITGWTTVSGEICALQITNPFNLISQDGGIFLDLTGYHDSSPYGGVEQTIATTAGQSYSLSFLIGVNNSSSGYRQPVSVTADVNGSDSTFTNSMTGTGNQWYLATENFTANSASTTITLTGLSTAGGQYIGLDAADVEATPEPMTWGMFGLGALALIRRNRKA